MESAIRKLTVNEEKLIEYLISTSSFEITSDWKDNTMALPMEDGGMGSIYLINKKKIDKERKFGRQINEMQYVDEDGVEVIISLNIDDKDQLYELDIWKTDYTSLIKFPIINDIYNNLRKIEH